MRPIVTFVLLGGAFTTACQRRAPQRDVTVPLPALVTDTVGPYRVRLNRQVDSSREFALLAAEGFTPSIDSVKAGAARAGRFNPSTVGPGQWWYDDFDGTRVPYALTADAVRYYLALIDRMATNGGRANENFVMTSASFRYVATVTPADSISSEQRRPGDRYVVDLDMQWSQYCGDLCSLRLEKHRRVWIGTSGRVLASEGDGLTQFVVSWRGSAAGRLVSNRIDLRTPAAA